MRVLYEVGRSGYQKRQIVARLGEVLVGFYSPGTFRCGRRVSYVSKKSSCKDSLSARGREQRLGQGRHE
jgi:hypothetical protein